MWLRTLTTFMNSVEIERIKLACFQILGPGVQVSISEINCPEPDCPPIKTVVMIFGEGEPARSVMLHKPIRQVTISDLNAVLRTNAFARAAEAK